MNMRQATTLTAIPMYLMILEDLHSVAWGMRNLSESSDTTATEPSSEHSQLVLLASVGVISNTMFKSNHENDNNILYSWDTCGNSGASTWVPGSVRTKALIPPSTLSDLGWKTIHKHSKLQTQNAYHEYGYGHGVAYFCLVSWCVLGMVINSKKFLAPTYMKQ